MKLRRIILFYFVCLVGVVSAFAANGHEIRFIYCSDLHYGIKRQFRGEKVDAYKVIGEMVKSFCLLNKTDLPSDGGVGEGTKFCEPDLLCVLAIYRTECMMGCGRHADHGGSLKKTG